MKTFFFAITFSCLSVLSFAQKPRVIKVEKLKAPDAALKVVSYQDIIKGLIRKDYGVTFADPVMQAKRDPQFNIIAKSKITDSLVNYGYHSFFTGMYNAYAQHRPFTLSPDMVWLLICQGFAQHVNNNSEALRPMFVNFKGKTTLTVINNKISINNPDSPWEDLFPEFSKQISEYTGKEFTDAMTANFTTTTPTTKMASQITTLYAMKSYFEFLHINIGCGIPTVTLEGTPADWQKVLDKTKALRKYKLDWWVDKLEPILINIVKAANGKNDKEFWQSMFKYHTINRYGARTVIDGWIVKFYPYFKNGKRTGLDSLSNGNDLPDEMVKVDLRESEGDGAGNFLETKLEMWAGFVGLKQTTKNFNLKPE